MKKYIFLLFTFYFSLTFAQRNAVFSQNSVLGDSVTTETYTLDEAALDSIQLFLASGYMPIKIDTFYATSNISIVALSDSIIRQDSTEYLSFTPRTDSLGNYSETITLNNNKIVTVSWNVISTDSLILAENSLAIATIDTFSLGNGAISTYTTDSLYLINQTNHYMDLVDIINYGDLGFDFEESRVEADSFLFGIFTYTPSINDTVNQNIKVVYKPYRNGYSDNSLDTIDLVVKVEVQIDANTLLPPENLTATQGTNAVDVSWTDTNVPDTVEVASYDFSESAQLDDFNATWSSELSLESGKLKVEDIGGTSYPGAEFIIAVGVGKTYKITTTGTLGTASEVGLYITDYPKTQTLYNQNFSNDTTIVYYLENVSFTQLFIQLQGETTADNQYVYHDNFMVEATESSLDGSKLYVRDWVNDSPVSDWALLTTTPNLSYLHTSIVDGNKYGYKAKFYKLDGVDTLFSAYSTEDTITYVVEITDTTDEYYLLTNKDGGNYDYAVSVTLTTNIVGGKIYYTTDGNTPTTSSDEYFEPIVLENTTTSSITKTIKAIASDGTNTTSQLSESYTLAGLYDVQTIATTTYMEAEGTKNYEGLSPIYEDDFASNGVYRMIPDYISATETKPSIIFKVTPSSSSTYYFWARVSGLHPDVYGGVAIAAGSGSFVDEGSYTRFYGDSTQYKGIGLFWKKYATESLTSGTTYSFRFRNSGNKIQMGVIVDKVCFTTGSGYHPPVYSITAPNGGERWSPSTSKNITWDYYGSSSNVKLDYSSDAGSTWDTITTSTSNDGTYTWTTPADTGDNYRIRITDVDGSDEFTESYNNFIITNIANPYDSLDTYEKYYSMIISSTMTLSDIYTSGSNQYPHYLNVQMADAGTDDLGDWGSIPDAEEIDTFRVDNNSVSKLLLYGNTQTQSSLTGEALMPRITDNEHWKMKSYITTGTIADSTQYTRNEGGYPRYGVYFPAETFIERMVQRTAYWEGYDIDGFYWDSFEPLTRFTYENENWVNFDGDNVYLINRETNAPFTYEEFSNAYRKMGYEVNRQNDYNLGLNAFETWANSKYRVYIMNEKYVDGYAFEGFAGSNSEVVMPGYYLSDDYLQTGIENVLLVQRQGAQAVLLTNRMTDVQSTDVQARYYEFCSMLLGIVNPDSKIYLRTYDGTGFEDVNFTILQRKRFVPLGAHQEIYKNIFKRDFQYATVYVNNNTTAKTVSFSASYYMESDGAWSVSTATSRSIPAMSGLIISTQKTDIE